jgi:hypothetical protein
MGSKFIERLEAAKSSHFKKGAERAKKLIPLLEDMILQSAEEGARGFTWVTEELKDMPGLALDGLREALDEHFAQEVKVKISEPAPDGRHNVEAEW